MHKPLVEFPDLEIPTFRLVLARQYGHDPGPDTATPPFHQLNELGARRAVLHERDIGVPLGDQSFVSVLQIDDIHAFPVTVEKVEQAVSNQLGRTDGVLVERGRLGGRVPTLYDMIMLPLVERTILRTEWKKIMAKDPFRLQGALGIGNRSLLVLRLEVGLTHFVAQLVEFAERQTLFVKQVAFRPLPDFVGTDLDRLRLVGNGRQTKMCPTSLLQ